MMDQGLKKRIEGFGVGVKCSYSQECGLNLTCVEGECRCMEVDKGGCDWTPTAPVKTGDLVSNSRRHKGLNVKKIMEMNMIRFLHCSMMMSACKCLQVPVVPMESSVLGDPFVVLEVGVPVPHLNGYCARSVCQARQNSWVAFDIYFEIRSRRHLRGWLKLCRRSMLCPAGTRPSPKIGNCVMYNQKSIETSSFALPTTALLEDLGSLSLQLQYVRH
uniref:EB domain-containing protein n=1 Tax=Ditylenchus dipsaci TaxID=166011 RepID=A0A915EA15_9BILA